MAVKNKVLFIASDAIYALFSQQSPADAWERFEDRWALKIIPNPEDVSSQQGEDLFGNITVSDYTDRRGLHAYSFDLRYNLYYFYKILQKIQAEAVSGGAPQQVEMVDFINPDPEDTQEDGGEIKGYTKRYGAIADLELIGSTMWQYTSTFVTGVGEYLKTYRCQGTRFRFEERGVPSELTLTAPAGSLSLYPLRDEFELSYDGGENVTDGYSATFVEVERKRRQITVNMALNDTSIVDTLLSLQSSCVLANGTFSSATLTYGGDSITGIIREVKPNGGIYTRTNKSTLLQETTNNGFSFRFTEV